MNYDKQGWKKILRKKYQIIVISKKTNQNTRNADFENKLPDAKG